MSWVVVTIAEDVDYDLQDESAVYTKRIQEVFGPFETEVAALEAGRRLERSFNYSCDDTEVRRLKAVPEL